MTPSRRTFLLAAAAFPLAACNSGDAVGQEINTPANEARYANSQWRRLTDAQWRERLPELSYRVLRHEATERAGTSALNEEHRRGTFVCLGCGLPMFRSQWKFNSGTGWPSFTRVIRENIGTKEDLLLFQPRIEYHCAQCLGHQGHIFDDGPRPTGLRYCNNGLALKFIPA